MRPDIKSTALSGIANLALLAPVRPGFVPGADTFTYSRRLEVLLKVLMAIRVGARESARHANPIPDAVGRLGILQSFRYALIPPRVGSRGEPPLPPGELDAGVYRLYLNVVFDGGWEPYLRVIYRDLGYLLDTIFCNTVGYRLSTRNSFDDYTRWVREHEVPAGLLYTESPGSVLDQRYLEAVERAERLEAEPARARQLAAGYALPPPLDTRAALLRLATADEDIRKEVVANNLRALKGLYDLRAFYPANDDGDGDRLLRFARRAMPEFCALLAANRGEPWALPHKESIEWVLGQPEPEAPPRQPPAAFDPRDIQPGIVEKQVGLTHGCLILLRVTDAPRARAWLGALPADTAARQAQAGGTLVWNLGLTANGLRALGQPAEVIDLLPQEFLEGMEARAGLLGDVRGNHPEHWKRPRFRGGNVEVDLGSVHVLVQYRLASATEGDRLLHSALEVLAAAIDRDRHGLLVLSVEPMRSWPVPGGEGRIVEHFGFQDGFSQPQPVWPAATGRAATPAPTAAPAPVLFDDTVKPGEIILGHAGDRDEGRFPDRAQPLLDNGSFLVIRKIRQHVGRWHAVLDRAATRRDPHHGARPASEQAATRARLAALLMGRRHDGTVLADPAVGSGNNFNYAADATGSRCPFAAHIRRANPRTALAPGATKLPRLLRRGMSFGPRFEADPGAERGLFFMAYCGSIAEQFEIIQRWLTGGNSSGVHSSHNDPMLGVPQKGVPRIHQWLGEDGQVQSIDLGDEAMTSLDWGLYLFAPSLTGLAALAAGAAAAPMALAAHGAGCPLKSEPYQPAGPEFERRKAMLQGRRDDRDQIWRAVVECGGELQTAYGRLEARKEQVLATLRDAGRRHSVCGYGRRFERSVGPGFLGMDDPEHKRLAVRSGIKQAVAAIDEPSAFAAARAATLRVLEGMVAVQARAGQAPAIDVVRLSETVVALLYKGWFGLPDERHMFTGFSSQAVLLDDEPARCPRDFFFVARYNFGAHPSEHERQRGTTRGQAIRAAVRGHVEATPPGQLVGLSKVIHDALMKHPDPAVGKEEAIQTIGGIMLGFGPSTHQHFVQVMRDWVDPRDSGATTIWDFQLGLLADGAAAASYEGVRKVMRAALLLQMRREPVPGIIWREKPGSTLNSDGSEPPKTALGLHALMGDDDAEDLMFGGTLAPGDRLFGAHACPGHGMAIGVLLGVISTLLLAGTLRRSPSPTILMLER